MYEHERNQFGIRKIQYGTVPMRACAFTLDAATVYLSRFTLVNLRAHLQEQNIPQRIIPCNNSARFPLAKHHESSSQWPKQCSRSLLRILRLGKLTPAYSRQREDIPDSISGILVFDIPSALGAPCAHSFARCI